MHRYLSLLSILLLANWAAIAAERPNFVYILADDMGHGDIQAINAECKYPTPNLDRLATEGMAFTQAYSGSSICTPTRYGIMTGRYCWRESVGLAGNYAGRYLPEGQTTVATFLREQGYQTIMIGKWHLGTSWTLKDGSVLPMKIKDTAHDQIDFTAPFYGGPVDHGFDYWFGIAGSLDFAPFLYLENNTATKVPTELMRTKDADGKTLTHRFGRREGLADPDLDSNQVMREFTKRTVAAISEHNGEQPFFLYMPLTAPHSPVYPHPDFVGASGIDEHADFRIEVDWCIGQVLDALETSGQADNTVVIFTADNGSASFAHASMMKESGHDSAGGRSGWKATMYEGGQRVPFLVRWPNGIEGINRRDNGVITLEDFYATTADILGAALPDEACDSVSFLPQLRGEDQDSGARDVVMSSLGNRYNLRHQDWKLVCIGEAELASHLSKGGKQKNKGKGKGKGKKDASADHGLPWHQRVALFNLHSDPTESTNVAADHPEVVAKLARFALAGFDNGRTNRGPSRPHSLNDSKAHQRELLEELSALASE
ncbi:MAG: sulfatase family protein [Planctomycetota bacterium]|jgi:arylsulfatase A-like enzyme